MRPWLQEGHNLAKPTLTWGKGWLDELNDTTNYSENRTNMLDAHATLTVIEGGKFQIEAIFNDGATDEYVYYEHPLAAGSIQVSPSIYNKWILRYKTNLSSAGAKAKVEIEFNDADTEVLLASTYSTDALWTVASGSIVDTVSNIKKVRFYADDDGVDGTFYVYYDFLMFHKGTFTFPNTAVRADFDALRRYADIEIPGREGTVTQNLGSQCLPITLISDLEQGSWGTPATDKFYDIFHNAKSESWQWFTCDKPKLNCKVTMRKFNPYYVGGRDGKPHCRLELREHRETDAANETYAERFGL